MTTTKDLQRFIDAQEHKFSIALNEIKSEKKLSHWMWFVFPQIAGLGFSDMSKLYAIKDVEEANLYITDPVLGKRLIDISNAVLAIEGKTAYEIFGSPDDMKLQSCMTLFSELENADPVFEAVLKKYYNGKKDAKTLGLMQK